MSSHYNPRFPSLTVTDDALLVKKDVRRNPTTSSQFSWALFIAYSTIVLTFELLRLTLHGMAGDLLMDINIGQWIVAHGHVPLHNHFTAALAGHPFSDTEWGFSLYVAEAYRIGGNIAVYLSLVPFLAVIAGFLGVWAQRAGRYGLLIAFLAGWALTITTNPRPQLVSYAAFALGLWAIQHARHHHWRPLLLFLASLPIWANMHQSVVLAPALLFGEVVFGPASGRKRMALATLAALGLMLLHPGGPTDSSHFFAHVLSPGVAGVIQEWQSPSFHTVDGWLILPYLMVAWGLIMPRAWREHRWTDLTWAAAGTLVTLWAVRFAPYMVLGIVAILPYYLPKSGRTRTMTPWLRRGAFVAALALTGLWVGVIYNGGPFPTAYPQTAMQYLQNHHAKNVVVYQQWSDAAEMANLQPWTNGQAQLWAQTAWWMPFVHAQGDSQLVVPWVNRWDPTAQWILWPIRGYDSYGGSIQASGWKLVAQDRTSSGVAGIWERIPTRKDAQL